MSEWLVCLVEWPAPTKEGVITMGRRDSRGDGVEMCIGIGIGVLYRCYVSRLFELEPSTVDIAIEMASIVRG